MGEKHSVRFEPVGPMVDAAIPLLQDLGVPTERIFYDRFTTTGDPEGAD